jgi:hypothetical protein
VCGERERIKGLGAGYDIPDLLYTFVFRAALPFALIAIARAVLIPWTRGGGRGGGGGRGCLCDRAPLRFSNSRANDSPWLSYIYIRMCIYTRIYTCIHRFIYIYMLSACNLTGADSAREPIAALSKSLYRDKRNPFVLTGYLLGRSLSRVVSNVRKEISLGARLCTGRRENSCAATIQSFC